MEKINVNISEYNQAHNKIDLYLDIELNEIFTHGSADGNPSGNLLWITMLPRDYVGASLAEWLRDNEMIQELIKAVKSLEAEDLIVEMQCLDELRELQEEIKHAFTHHEITAYWKSSDWLAPLSDSERLKLAQKQPRDEVLDDILFEAEHDGCHLDREELNNYFDEILKQ